MSYMEEVFERAELQLKDESKILDWLGSFERPERGATAYTRDAVTVRDELISSIATRGEAERIDTTWENVDILRDLLNEEGSRVGKAEGTITTLKSQIKIAEKAEVEEVARQEALRTEKESRKLLISEYKKAETVEEWKEMREELREILPYSLRTLKGWETKEGSKVFEELMIF